MFGIAKCQNLKNVDDTIGFEKMIIENIKLFNEGCFIIRQINHDVAINQCISKIQIDDIDNIIYPTNKLYEYIDKKIDIKNILILPLDIPDTIEKENFIKSLIDYCYTGYFDEKIFSDEIVCTMIFTILQQIIFKLGRLDINMNEIEEKNYIKICLSFFNTLKRFTETSKTFSHLIHSLALCTEPKDILQREIAVIIDNQPFNETFFQQILQLSIKRKMRRQYNKDPNEQLTLTQITELSGLNSTFTIIPLLKMCTGRNEENINIFCEKKNACKNLLFNEKNKELFNQNDINFDISGKICQILVIGMVKVIGINIKIPNVSWFASLINEINNKKIEFSRDVDNCPFKIGCADVVINKFGKITKKISYANGFFTSPTLVGWASFELSMKDGETYELNYEKLNVNDLSDELIFLCKEKEPVQLYFNPGGSYSIPSNEIFDKNIKKYIDDKNKIESPLKLICFNNTIDLIDNKNHICFRGNNNSIIICIKNISLNIVKK